MGKTQELIEVIIPYLESGKIHCTFFSRTLRQAMNIEKRLLKALPETLVLEKRQTASGFGPKLFFTNGSQVSFTQSGENCVLCTGK